jgi:hypothetical protein
MLDEYEWVVRELNHKKEENFAKIKKKSEKWMKEIGLPNVMFY